MLTRNEEPHVKRLVGGEFVDDPHGIVNDALQGRPLNPREVHELHQEVEAVYESGLSPETKQALLQDRLLDVEVTLERYQMYDRRT